MLVFIIYSCTPRIIANEEIFTKKESNEKIIKNNKKNTPKTESKKELTLSNVEIEHDYTNVEIEHDYKILSDIEVILPINENIEITEHFINSLELSIYKKNINNLSLNINPYYQKDDLHKIIKNKIEPGKIFIGPLTSSDTEDLKEYCSSGVIFFSFASKRQLGLDCVYLINFFPEDDLETLFSYFDSNSRIALLYPQNHYGKYINKIIDKISVDSKALVVNKVSYNEDFSNAREAIKQLGKYDSRKNELERQKKILKNKDDEISKKALKKIEKFETIGVLDFTHVIIADSNIRLLEIAPLLPFYDIDPNKIQFVGTGVWDDEAFFDEPSLQRAIFPGVAKKNRSDFIQEYIDAYALEPIRTATIMYDLTGLLSYIVENNLTLKSTQKLLNNQRLSFEGIDGRFVFKDNLIKRNLDILKIKDGKAVLVN